MMCPRCGAELPAGARFCPSCGLELQAVTPHAERKLVSVLFCDQVGSTARAETADPEDVRDINRVYYDEARARIERFGGIVEKFAGDAVMAVFGAPLARSDDAERAVRAALSILKGVDEINDRYPGLDLSVRIGVCTGEAIVEVDAPPDSAIAWGDVVNTAARLEAAAPAGRVYVGAETYRLTRHAFALDEAGPVIAKGKRDPVRAWLVTEPHAVGVDVVEPTTPLVGRERELQLARGLWERAMEGRPQLLSVVGPIGIGKSRYVREIVRSLEAEGGRALWGRSLAYDEQTPYHAAGQMVRRLAGIFDTDPMDVAREKLAGYVAEALPGEAADVTRYLSLLLGLGLDEGAREAIHLHFAMRRLVEALAEATPVVMVFEDVHWADDILLSLIVYLATHAQDHRVMIVVTARPEFLEKHGGWAARAPAHTSVSLSALTDAEAAAVAAALLGSGPTAVSRIVAAAEGNPLFLEELAASIQEEAAGQQLPSSVRAVVAARIDGLPAGARDALLAASVIGHTFWRGVLARIVAGDNVDEALESLESRGMVQRRRTSQVEGETEYVFKHDLIRETAYATLSRATRRDLHRTTASVLESLVRDPAEIAWILAHHHRESGDAEGAIAYLSIAADRARDARAVDETFDLWTQSAELASNDQQRDELMLKRALAMVLLEDFARGAAEIDALLPRLDGVAEIEALLARARASYWTERTDDALSFSERALRLARERGAADLEAAALGMSGSAHSMRGDPGDLERAVEIGNRALAIWPAGARPIEHAETFHNQATYCYWVGDYDRAVQRARDAHRTAGTDPGSGESLLRGAGLEGLVLAGLGRYEEAIAIANESIELAKRMGRPTNVTMNYSTLPLREIFALEEARARSEEVVSRLGPSDFNMPWMNARCDLLAAELLGGNLAQVEAGWSALWDEARASRAWVRWHISGRSAEIRAEYEIERGRYGDALEWGRRALELAQASSRIKYEVLARITVAKALIAQGIGDEAASELRTAVAAADRLGSPLLRWQARATLADVGAKVKDGIDVDAIRSEAVAIVREIVAGLSNEHAKGYLAAPAVATLLEGA